MDIQFNHQNGNNFVPRNQKQTFAVLLPSAETFTELLENPDRSITLGVGVAVCSPKDNYCKKTGRDLSSSRIRPIMYRLRTMHFINRDVFFDLNSDEGDYLQVKMSAKSQRLHLLKAY